MTMWAFVIAFFLNSNGDFPRVTERYETERECREARAAFVIYTLDALIGPCFPELHDLNFLGEQRT